MDQATVTVTVEDSDQGVGHGAAGEERGPEREGCRISGLGVVAEHGVGEVAHTCAVDQLLALQDAAQQQPDDDQHDRDLDQGETALPVLDPAQTRHVI